MRYRTSAIITAPDRRALFRDRRYLVHNHGRSFAGSKAFTLMEVIIVVLLISLSLAVFLGINFNQKESLQLKSDGRQVFSLLQAAKSYALLYGNPNTCLYDPGRNVVIESLRNKTVGLHDEVFIPRPEGDDGKDGAPFVIMSFFADGSASGGEVELRSGKRKLYLQVDPILGEVKVSDKSSSTHQ